jgi:hypothetical protein
MRNMTVGGLAFALFVFTTVAYTPRSAAQSCSASEQRRIDTREAQAVALLEEEDIGAYQELQRAPIPGLSSTCRKAQARDNPASIECNGKEKRLVLVRMREVYDAANSGNPLGMLDALDAMQEAISSRCWLALFYSTDRAIQRSCSSKDLRLVASSASDVLVAVRTVLVSGPEAAAESLGELAQTTQTRLSRLSPDCAAAWQQFQAAPALRHSGLPMQSVPGVSNVYDHGAGVYSVPGLGACAPISGCIAY